MRGLAGSLQLLRAYLLQHGLSGGNGTGIFLPFLAVPSSDRCGEMQELQFVFPWMQGCLHRLQEPSHRLQPLRSVHGLYRHRPPQLPFGNSRACRHVCGKSAGKESGRRTGGHRGQKDTGTCHADCTAGCMERTPFCPALYGLPALRVGLSQQRTPTFNRTAKADAARSVLRTGILPSGVYALFRCVSGWGNLSDYH